MTVFDLNKEIHYFDFDCSFKEELPPLMFTKVMPFPKKVIIKPHLVNMFPKNVVVKSFSMRGQLLGCLLWGGERGWEEGGHFAQDVSLT